MPPGNRAARLRAQARVQDMLQSQLEVARAQAEGWRNFLATATALLAAVLVLKGRENVADLPADFRYAVVACTACGLLALLASAFAVASAAHGTPGQALVYADGAALLRWESAEVRRIGRLVARARLLAVAGVLATAAAVLLTWTAPTSDAAPALVTVHTPDGAVCGELVGTDRTGVTVRVQGRGPDGKDTLRRLEWGAGALSASPAESC
ncbi:hypothetical protein [Streptomyces sp. NPDC021020]|uniref:hypothetical protein n=1 Tax=Streptomyces sp. NPDC021020 TaxID=3365109 RepID=UPI0037AAEEFE